MVRERNKPVKSVVNKSLLTYLNPGSAISEQYRMIRNNIHYASVGSKMRSLLVTSPSVGEGKTTAAVNLAVCMAQRGDKVLLIDANLRKPTLQYVFNVKSLAGLTNVLAHQIQLREAIQQTEIGRLDLLPSGPLLYNSMELLDSQTMVDLMEIATDHYDMVLLDGPPVLGVPETNALASKCDSVILLLMSDKTQHEMAVEAKRSLEFAKANILGVILNKKSG